MKNRIILTAALIAISVSNSWADVVVTTDGSRLTGTITLIDKGVIHLETAYAGTLKISQEMVETFETEEPIVVRLDSGTVMSGPVKSSGSKKLKIQSSDGVLETDTAKIATSWSPDAEDPEVVRNRRQWKYQASLDLNGKSGNTEKFNFGTQLEAKLEGPNDTLSFFAEYEQGEEEGNKTDDNAEIGGSYQSFFSEKLGWYIGTSAETDGINDIDFRSTSAAGLSYRLINKDHQKLVARSGLGYRYTAFGADADDESTATLDFGLNHTYKYKDIFEMENDLTYTPSIDDFGVYTAVHDSGIELPVGSGKNWKIRLGVKNEYESEPAAEEKLDTTYYTRMIYSWD
ncbi:MAG: DUF481 domain-containing protein [Verrucomicrobiota bacterium]